MKIGILVDEIAPGSAPKLIGWPIRRLRELGIEAEALVVIEKEHWQRHREHYDSHLQGVPIRYLFPSFPSWARRINFKFPGMSFFSLHHILSYWFAHRAVRDKEFDMIIAHCQYSAFAARNLKRKRGIPFLLLLWDPATFTAEKIYRRRFGILFPLLYRAAKMLDRFAVHECCGVITSGRFHHAHLRRLTDKPLYILPPGCFVKSEWPAFFRRKPMMLTYDRWDIGNIPTIFLDILQRTSRPDITLTIGGFWHPVGLRDEFTREVARRGLAGRVNLLGPLNEDMIVDLCSQAMVHVHPVHEAFGMQTLEAAACGCPIIIPAGSGVTDLFEQGTHGYFPAPGDLTELVACVNKIFDDPVLAERLSRNAWCAAQGNDWLAYAKNLVTIVNNYLPGRQAPPAGVSPLPVEKSQACPFV